MKDIPAFPSTHPDLSYMGMTLRDYFAAKAMQGWVAAGQEYNMADLVKWSYKVADAMLKAREA